MGALSDLDLESGAFETRAWWIKTMIQILAGLVNKILMKRITADHQDFFGSN